MKLSKAIEILNRLPIPLKTPEDHDVFDAIKLSIEGLKRVQEMRSWPNHICKLPLPGETPEEEVESET